MKQSIGKGTPLDYGEIIEVANRAFGCDFPALLPKLYRNHPETSADHHLLKDEGRIKAMVGSFPLAMKVGDETLKMRGIGTVCVESDARRLGYMRVLMDEAMSEAEAEGCDLAEVAAVIAIARYPGYPSFDHVGRIRGGRRQQRRDRARA